LVPNIGLQYCRNEGRISGGWTATRQAKALVQSLTIIQKKARIG
jgi:hypothetical protein